MGKTLASVGEFEFMGQAKDIIKLDLSLLQAMPEVSFVEPFASISGYAHLKNVAYQPGFPLPSKDTFNKTSSAYPKSSL